jgi:hypothetical protein
MMCRTLWRGASYLSLGSVKNWSRWRNLKWATASQSHGICVADSSSSRHLLREWSSVPCGYTTLAICFHAEIFLGLFDPKDGAICSSETSVDFQRTTRHYTPEDSTLHCIALFGLRTCAYDVELEFFLGVWSQKSEHILPRPEGPSGRELMACRRGNTLVTVSYGDVLFVTSKQQECILVHSI